MMKFENISPQGHGDTEKIKNLSSPERSDLVFSVSLCLCGEIPGVAK